METNAHMNVVVYSIYSYTSFKRAHTKTLSVKTQEIATLKVTRGGNA